MKSKKVQVIKKPAVKKTAVRKPVLKNTEEEPALSLVTLHNLKRPFGARKRKKLLGRGSSSGHGKTSTRGSKGQTSRAGRHFYLGFEGGQSPLIRRMPKRGFVSNFKKVYQIVNLEDLNKIKEAIVTPQLLKDNGLIRNERALIKILGNGSIKNSVTIQAHAFSKRAAQEIVSAGGKAEIINI
ncbi:MAG: 50S ribosomal protein L15 [Candidatus Omnitrophica bacterium]|nr:50S ribosomal protein L15 [Candidatus Omnitrophota bacterium]MBU1922777.1 50S ribosomal protein L15 [Candidatus Omnitrophota bacterium]